MVENHICPHPVQQFIKALCGKALKESIRFTFASDAIDDFCAIQVCIHHFVHGIDIILPVTVNGNGNITLVLRFH